ncbi:hypothetical protein DPMN_086262 [Dreissena polymorpha]|uniref:Uncharacterized protein n=1 Tax=Dreissena polymorpha TaxID=45954 RepID=A0A9D3YHI7_DREPO|nr:hypothetical protein DPMN_086262 [Dreissena polymorpha]
MRTTCHPQLVWCGGRVVTLCISFQRSPVKYQAGALEISEMLQVFTTQLEMYWYETHVILARIGAIH